jgi:hypothetical protein
MNTRGIFVLLVICVLTTCVWWWYRSDKPGDVVTDEGLSTSTPSVEAPTPLIPPSNPSPVSSSPAVIWSVVSNKSEMPDIPGSQSDIEDAVSVRVNYDSLLNLSIGDSIIVEIPQLNSQITTVLEKIKTHINGIKTITAASLDNSASLLVTIGKKSIFANISTPRGSYEFVGNTTHGWLMPSANMDQHVDYTKPDYVITEIEPRIGVGEEDDD